jgi:hypothetical protein
MPRTADERRQQLVQQDRGEIEQRHAQHDGQPLEVAGPSQPGAVEQLPDAGVAPAAADLVVQLGNRRERLRREQPDGRPLGLLHALDDDVQRTLGTLDRADNLLIGLQWIRARALGFVAQLGEPRRQPRIEHDEQLVAECGRIAAFQVGAQVLDRDLGLGVAAGLEESQHRAPRRVPAERVLLRRRRRRRRGRVRRRLRPGGGQ